MSKRTTREQSIFDHTLEQVCSELSEEGFDYWEQVLTAQEREEFIQGYIDGDMEISEENAECGTLNVVWEVQKMEREHQRVRSAAIIKDAVNRCAEIFDKAR